MLQFGVFPPPHGGVQTNVVAIRDYLREHGVRAGVVNLTRHRREDADVVFYPKTPFGVVSRMLTFPADILHFHLGGQIMPRLLGLYLAGSLMPGKKTVLTFHSGGYPTTPEGLAANARGLRALVFRRLDRIVAVNAAIVDLFRRFGVASEKIRLIAPHALPSRAPEVELPVALRSFLETHGPILLSVGLLEPEYDLALQIEVMGRVLAAHPNAGLVIAGAGSLENELRRQIAAQPYAENILLYGDMPYPITLNLIAGCDLLLRTTLYDGDSVSVREALHFGTPVIASDNGMRPPGVRLIPRSDLAALHAAIEAQLAAGRTAQAQTPANAENLEAMLRLYRELSGSH